jgi:hypothetical protein
VKVWITKYALTSGVFTREVEEPNDGSPAMIHDDSSGYMACYYGHDWHRTRRDAIERVSKMREAKIASLTRSLRKIIDQPIEVPE